MKKKDQNKGFTLVELIVVLVILAILAAILVPALLGYIDNAKTKQTVLNAKSALTAAQAEMSNIYASKSEIASAIENKAHAESVASIADFPSIGVTATNNAAFEVGCAAKATDAASKKSEHNAYTISWAHYKDGTGEVWFNGSEGVDKAASAPTPASGAYQIFPVKTTTP